jgi:hypothetical protein
MTDLFATSRCPWGLPEGQVNQPERRAPIARNDRSIVHFTGNIFRLIDDPVDSWTVETPFAAVRASRRPASQAFYMVVGLGPGRFALPKR